MIFEPNPYREETVIFKIQHEYVHEQPLRYENHIAYCEIKDKIKEIQNGRRLLSVEERSLGHTSEIRVHFAQNEKLYNEWEEEQYRLYQC